MSNMQGLELFTNLGIAGASLFIIYFIVKYFVQAMTKKDDYIIEQTREFTKQTSSFENTVKNHLSHSVQAFSKLALAVEHLAKNGDKKKKEK